VSKGEKASPRRTSQLDLLVTEGLLHVGQRLYFRRSDEWVAVVELDSEGRAWLRVGEELHPSPSRASTDLAGGTASNGYRDLWFDDADGTRRRLDVLRQRVEG
jgi:hypothetical protein